MEPNTDQEVETRPDHKKAFLILAVVVGVLVVAAAAFVGGRLLNGSGTQFGGILMNGGLANVSSMSIEFLPAPELPSTQPELVGTFSERLDNSLYIQEFSMDAGAGGGVIVGSSSVSVSGGEGDQPGVQMIGGGGTGPRVEVVVTGDTLVYKDVTEMDFNANAEATTIQQVVAIGSLDELNTQTMVQVWGRRIGDRVIAEVIFYNNPVLISMP
jgi:hypothetical protein